MRPINIDSLLLSALANADPWSAAQAEKLARDRAAMAGLSVDWDRDSPESWIRLMGQDEPVAYLYVGLPIVLATEHFGWPDPVVAVKLDSLDAALMTAAEVLMAAAFGHAVLTGLQTTGFSADDLWYATV